MATLLCVALGVTTGPANGARPQPVSAQGRTFDLLNASIQDIQDAVAAGALSYERLASLYLARIAAYDKQGPRLNAIIEINPHALDEARAMDVERRTKGVRGPLHGIPIAIKDNIDVHDVPSAGGNAALAGTYPARDATVIRRLRAAGAIIIAKTNMDELAMGSQGLSSAGGQILNPFNLRHSPGGSSGGSAVAVNAGFATVALATETGLSIRGPASNNALVGIAPTRGLVSRAGVIPLSFTQDRVGVHAKTVADAALVLTQIRGFDAEDLSTSAALGTLLPPSYGADLTLLPGSRIGVLKELFRVGPQFAAGNALVRSAIDRLKGQATVIDDLTTGLDLLAMGPELRLNYYELRFGFDAYLQRRGPAAPVKSLADLLATGKYLKSLDSRFKTAMSVVSLDSDAEYRRRVLGQQQLRQALLAVMDRYQLDALVYPVKSLGAPLVGSSDDGERDNPTSAIAGLPAVVLPAGLDPDGLPIALELMGRPFTESRLLQLAAAYERVRGPRPTPTTTPSREGEKFSHR